jgi:glycine dehydrogenase
MSGDAYEPYDFANRRHIGPSSEEIVESLRVVGVSSLDALVDETVPKDIRLGKAAEAVRALRASANLHPVRDSPKRTRPSWSPGQGARSRSGGSHKATSGAQFRRQLHA